MAKQTREDLEQDLKELIAFNSLLRIQLRTTLRPPARW